MVDANPMFMFIRANKVFPKLKTKFGAMGAIWWDTFGGRCLFCNFHSDTGDHVGKKKVPVSSQTIQEFRTFFATVL